MYMYLQAQVTFTLQNDKMGQRGPAPGHGNFILNFKFDGKIH